MPRPYSARSPLLVCLLAGGFLAGCGDDDSPTQPTPAQPTGVSGNSNKAPISGASVKIYQLNANTTVGAFVAGPYTTTANGNWTGALPAGTSGPLVMVSTGGSYTDEATGTPVTLAATDTLYGVLQGTSSAVTPLTHAAFLAIRALVAGGMPLATAITQASNASMSAFGFNFTTTIPNAAGTGGALNYSYLLGGLSSLLNANPALSAFASTPPFELVMAIATDMADGQMDGLAPGGIVIQVFTDASHTTTAPLPALSPTNLSAWLTAANTYAGSTLFNVNLTWNPSSSGGVGTYGSVDYVTSGTTFPSGTATPDSAGVSGGTTFVWRDRPNHIEIQAVLANQTLYPGSVQTVYFTDLAGSRGWLAHGVSGIGGVAVSGNITTFTDALVVDLATGNQQVRITGALTNP